MWYVTKMKTPLDPSLLESLLQEQVEQNKALRKQLSEQTTLLRQQSILVENLQQQIAQLQRMLFGQKSERQPKASQDNKDAEKQTTTTNKVSRQNSAESQGNGRRQFPAHLERVTIIHDLPEQEKHCPCCHSHLKKIGEQTTEQLDFVPAKLIVNQHVKYKYACKRCQGHIATAKMPEQPIDKGAAGSGLLAEVLINKYDDAMPLYRQERRWQRLGYALPRSSLCDWVMQCAERLKPIVDAMVQQCVLTAQKIHTDDTTVPILAKGKTHTGRLWVYRSGGLAPPCVVYQYSKTRRKSVPENFFKQYKGYIQADAYAGYDCLFESNDRIEVGCMAHARRKFTDILNSVPSSALTHQAIDYFAQLYQIEKQAKAMTPQQRYYFRRYWAKPILKQFYRWLKTTYAHAPPKAPLAKAIQYTLNHWQALNNYLRDGILDIDNNAAERAIRPLVIGRKNYLFAGSHQGAEAAAVIYSLIETCKINGINSYQYIKSTLEKLPTTLHKDIHTLFPVNWIPLD